jgi:hypothetical protein
MAAQVTVLSMVERGVHRNIHMFLLRGIGCYGKAMPSNILL